MNQCEQCKKYKVCKWRDDAAEIFNTIIEVPLNPASPFSIVLWCAEFEKNELVW